MDRNLIPQFTGAAYNAWAFKVEYGLIEKKLSSAVFDVEGRARKPCPVVIAPLTQGELILIPLDDRMVAKDEKREEIKTREAEIEAWIDRDMEARAFIVKYLGASEHTHVRNCKSAFEMWNSLKNFYELQGEIEIANATAQLSAIIMTEAEDITTYVRRLQELHSLLDRLGEAVAPTKQATNLLNSLNTKYSPMVKTIQTWSQTAPQLYNVPNILSTLVQEDVREEINARKRGEPLQGFGAPQVNYGGPPAHRAQRPGSSGGNWKSKIQCHGCHEFGHLKSECPKPKLMVTCHGCGMRGHVKANCQARGSGGGIKPDGAYKGNYMKCKHCGNPGHTMENCRTRIQDMGAAARLAASSSTNFDASQSLSYTATSHALSSTSNKKMPLILDSGATDHIFPSSDCFSEYSTDAVPLSSAFIYTADDKPHEVKGSGIVTLRLHRGMEETTVRLHALHVPSLGQTLVSLACINRRGGVEFQLSKIGVPTLTKDGQTWADLSTTKNGLFLLSGSIVMPDLVKSRSESVGHALSVGQDWHLRLGHPGLTMMKEMSSKGLIPVLTSSECEEVQTCEVCCQAKMAQSPHKKVSESSKACAKMDKIHLDLVGPLAVKSAHGGYSYFQSGIDVGSRLSFVSLLKLKSEALEVSKVLIASLESDSSLPLKSVRTDGGGEYCSADWTNFLQGKGTAHELTAPYSPQQNGMAERLNRTLLEKMRCLLIWSCLPKSFWDVALLHSNYLRNRSPTSSLKGNIPLEAWSGKKQVGFTKMHTFGCLVQYLKRGPEKGKQSEKFASRTAFGIFLGMPSKQAGYLVWDPQRTGVLVRDDVRFFDNIPGYPRLMSKAARQPEQPRDDDYFSQFPVDEEAAATPTTPASPSTLAKSAATPPPSLLPPVTPIDAIQLSSDTELGAHNDEEDDDEGEVSGGMGESIADRVASRRRAHFAAFGDVL